LVNPKIPPDRWTPTADDLCYKKDAYDKCITRDFVPPGRWAPKGNDLCYTFKDTNGKDTETCVRKNLVLGEVQIIKPPPRR